MTHRPIFKQMPSGRMFDLSNPTADQVDFVADVAPALAFISRFDGSCVVKGKPWTVLDHLVVGYDIIYREAGPRMAALWLLHDAHEAYLGDLTSPAASFIAFCAGPSSSGSIKAAIGAAKAKLDCAIFARAGVEPPTVNEAGLLHLFDLSMLVTERNHMMADPWRPWGDLERIAPFRIPGKGKLKPGQPTERMTEFMCRLAKAAPHSRTQLQPAALAAHR